MTRQARPLPPEVWTPEWQAAFWARVDKSGACWEWLGYRHVAGRAVVCVGKQRIYAYRVAFALHAGSDPGSLSVCHRCDNPSCVRPAHLFLGTQADNSRDMWGKGRGVAPPRVSGEAHGQVRIRDARVAEARRLYESGLLTQQALSVRFDVSQSTIGRWTRGVQRTEAEGPTRTVGKGRRHPARPVVACIESGCGAPAATKGRCRLHYLRSWRAAQRELRETA